MLIHTFDRITINYNDCIIINLMETPNTYFSSNLKFLRNRKKKTQEFVATSLNMTRSTLNNYENGNTAPSLKALIALADYYRISVDSLLRIDLSQLRESQFYELENGVNVFLKGKNIRVLATTVDSQNKENVEMIPLKAKAGYLNGYSDPEYISELPVFKLPFLSQEKKYRVFPIEGDSMLPIPDGAWVTGEYVQDWNQIKNDQLYIILTMNDGLVFKKVRNEIEEFQRLQLISLNPIYEPYSLPDSEILEVWKFVNYISTELPDNIDMIQIGHNLMELRRDIGVIKNRIS
jgi:transcriptional regulator with XRE-family HTH domain